MSFVIWITGLPGSGKSTVADRLKAAIPDAVILRMDDLRKTVTPNPTFSNEEREILYRSLVYMAGILYKNGHTVILDATANMRRWRDLARDTIKDYFEVSLRCPLEECRKREMKRVDTHQAPLDIYKKAEEGWPVPGINVPYEAPLDPEIAIDTDKTDVDTTVEIILKTIQKNY